MVLPAASAPSEVVVNEIVTGTEDLPETRSDEATMNDTEVTCVAGTKVKLNMPTTETG